MPLPFLATALINEAETVNTDLEAVSTAIEALPATPVEADLPEIVQVVAGLNDAAQTLQGIVAQILTILSTTRVNQ